MTDLRTAAQAVIDIYDLKVIIGVLEPFAGNYIEALRQALAEPVEPVVVQVNGHVFHRDGKQFIQFEQKSPSVDALIGEIEGLSKPYAPMTDDERAKWLASELGNMALLEKFEAAVIKRAGLDVEGGGV